MRRNQRKGMLAVRRRRCSRSSCSCVVVYFGFTKHDPVHAPLHGQGRLPVGQQHPHRTRRCASPASTSARSPTIEPRRGRQHGARRDDARSTRRACRSTRTRRSRSARASSSRATSSSTCSPGSPSAPTLGDGDTIPINQTSDAGAARPGAHRAAGADAQGPAGAAATSCRTGLTGAGARGYNRSIPYWKPAYRDTRDRRRRAAGHAARRPRRATSTRPASTAAAHRPQPRAAQVARHRLRHHGRPPSPRATRSCRRPSASCRAR